MKKTGGPMQHRLLRSTVRSTAHKGVSRLGRKLSTGATECQPSHLTGTSPRFGRRPKGSVVMVRAVLLLIRLESLRATALTSRFARTERRLATTPGKSITIVWPRVAFTVAVDRRSAARTAPAILCTAFMAPTAARFTGAGTHTAVGLIAGDKAAPLEACDRRRRAAR